MKINALLIICSLLLSCSFPDSGCDDHSCDEKCEAVLKEHVKSLMLKMYVRCPFDSVCKSSISFGWVREYGSSFTTCYKNYEYRFESDFSHGNVSMNSEMWVPFDSNDHVRFSLFDRTNAEKNYDIDLSKVIHSYTIKHDSVIIEVPNNVESVHLYKENFYRSSHDIIEIVPDSLNNGRYVFYPDSLYHDNLFIKYGINILTPFGEDTISVSTTLYYRKCERYEDEFICENDGG